MPLIQIPEIQSLVDFFNTRGVKIYHACQYKDFKTYLEIGGVPSRNLLEQSKLSYTTFDTDDVDKKHEVWNKVFANLSDFGFAFAQGKKNENTAPTPCVYGPILLIFNPEVLFETLDVAICLRSAGGRDFNRAAESLGSVNDINRLFKYPRVEDAPTEYARAYIKYASELKAEFNNPHATSPEVSCTVNDERFSLKYLEKIIVDSYTVCAQDLFVKIERLKRAYRLESVVWERKYNEGRREIKQELGNLLLQQHFTLDEIIHNESNSEALRDWASRVNKGGISWQYDRFAKYLRSGTIIELQNEAS